MWFRRSRGCGRSSGCEGAGRGGGCVAPAAAVAARGVPIEDAVRRGVGDEDLDVVRDQLPSGAQRVVVEVVGPIDELGYPGRAVETHAPVLVDLVLQVLSVAEDGTAALGPRLHVA